MSHRRYKLFWGDESVTVFSPNLCMAVTKARKILQLDLIGTSKERFNGKPTRVIQLDG